MGLAISYPHSSIHKSFKFTFQKMHSMDECQLKPIDMATKEQIKFSEDNSLLSKGEPDRCRAKRRGGLRRRGTDLKDKRNSR